MMLSFSPTAVTFENDCIVAPDCKTLAPKPPTLAVEDADAVADAKRFLIHEALTLDVVATVAETFLVLAASETTPETVATDILEPRTRLNPTPVTVVD